MIVNILKQLPSGTKVRVLISVVLLDEIPVDNGVKQRDILAQHYLDFWEECSFGLQKCGKCFWFAKV